MCRPHTAPHEDSDLNWVICGQGTRPYERFYGLDYLISAGGEPRPYERFYRLDYLIIYLIIIWSGVGTPPTFWRIKNWYLYLLLKLRYYDKLR